MTGMRWYIVNAFSNFEKKVAEAIRENAEQRNLSDMIGEILVPSEKIVEVRRGRKFEVDRTFFPGYVLVRAVLTDEVFHLIKNTPKVAGFLGTGKKPVPIPDSEAERIKSQIVDSVAKPKSLISYTVGEHVRVSDGPFVSFNGVVEDVDNVRNRLKVAVSIFGRATPVELEFDQVQRIR